MTDRAALVMATDHFTSYFYVQGAADGSGPILLRQYTRPAPDGVWVSLVDLRRHALSDRDCADAKMVALAPPTSSGWG